MSRGGFSAHTLDDALTEREHELRRAVIRWMHGEKVPFPDPANPTAIEKHYLSAIAYFEQKRMVMGIEAFDRGDYRALLAHQRKRKGRR